MQDNNIIQKAIDCINNLDSKIKRLEAENEKLKEDLKAETEQAQKWYQLETDKHFLALKYLNALEKIKEIAETEINELTDSAVYGGRYFEILDLINESGG